MAISKSTIIDKAIFKENSISSRNGGIGSVIMDRQARTSIGVPTLNIEIFL